MKKILFAFSSMNEADIKITEYLRKTLAKKRVYVGQASYRERVIPMIEAEQPHEVLINETITGGINILDLIFEIRQKFPEVRIILIGKARKATSKFNRTLYKYSVFDVISKSHVSAEEIVDLVYTPKTFLDVQPYFDYSERYDPKTNRISYGVEFGVPEPQDAQNQSKNKRNNKKENDSAAKNVLSLFSDKHGEKKSEGDGSKDKVSVVKRKETERIDKVESKSQIDFRANGAGRKIVVFTGLRGNEGVTTAGLASAYMFAQAKKKVLYIEVNEENPTLPVVYRFDEIDKRLEVIMGNNGNSYKTFREAIIKIERKRNRDTGEILYKEVPKGVDFLISDIRFGKIEEYGKEHADKLMANVMKCIMDQDYDYVFIDLHHSLSEEFRSTVYEHASKIYCFASQNLVSSSYLNYYFENPNGVNIFLEKVEFVVNQFMNSKKMLSKKKMDTWFKKKPIYISFDRGQVACLENLEELKNNSQFLADIAMLCNNIQRG